MNAPPEFALMRRRVLGLLAATPALGPLLGHAQTCPANDVNNPAVSGHGMGLDFYGTSNTAVRTGAFNSTSGGIVVTSVGRGAFADFSRSTVSDNKGNGNYTQIGAAHTYVKWQSSGTALYAKTAAAGGAGHVVSTGKPTATDEVSVISIAFSGVSAIVDSKWVEDLSAPNTSASVTTTGPAALAAFWWGDDGSGEIKPAVSAGWTLLDHSSSLASNHVQCASACRIVTAAGSYSIDWTPSTSQGAQLWIVAMQ